MVDIQHTTHILENLASQAGRASLNAGAERRENIALDAQFDATLEELNKESVSMLNNVLTGELINQSEHSEMARFTDDSDVDEDESFKQDYGIAGREEDDQNQQGRDQKHENEDELHASIAQALHDDFESALHDRDLHDENSQSEDTSMSSSSGKTGPGELTVFDLVPPTKAENGLENWVSEVSLEEIFVDTLGQENVESSADLTVTQNTEILPSIKNITDN